MIKRIFDVVVSFSALLVLGPFIMLAGLLVWVMSGPPIFFKQIRVGFEGREFFIYKLRTMVPVRDGETSSFDVGCDARVTGLGRVLRVTKFDELPQLWNVLKGDMSLVGPRPEVRKWVEVFPERWAAVHSVRPGITDYASVMYRNEEDLLMDSGNPEATYREEILPRKLELYEQYVETRTFLGDLKIICQTLKAVIHR